MNRNQVRFFRDESCRELLATIPIDDGGVFREAGLSGPTSDTMVSRLAKLAVVSMGLLTENEAERAFIMLG